jgi:DNA-binding NarL/FixJ family response regulator
VVSELCRVLIIDDHPLFRDALTTAVKLGYPNTRADEAASMDAAIVALDIESDYDIALLDLNLPGVHGFDGLLRLRTLYPRLPVLVVSGLETCEIIKEAIHFGAAGFLPKSLGREVLVTAIETILAGDVYLPENWQITESESDSDTQSIGDSLLSLTPQQMRVLFMLREGLLNKQIAHELDVGATTVKKHVSEILRKLGVHSRTQAVIEVSKLDNDELFDIERRFNST